ncbi:MAG: WG repeat-containing protein [Saprospiraceae bacterium]
MRESLIIFLMLLFGSSLFAQVGKVNKETFFPVKIDKQWGMMNSKGEVVIKPQYDAIGEFKEHGYAVMQRKGRVGLVNKYGREVLPPEYDDIKILDSLLFAVLDVSDWKVVNIEGKVILNNGYEQVHIWKRKYISFRQNRKWGIANIEGEIITSPKYDEIILLDNEFFQTKINDKLGLMSNDGKEILANESSQIEIYNPQLFFFQKNKKWGAVNQKGQQLIRPSFQSFFTLSDNFIKLIANSRVYLYSVPKEKIITKGQYETYYTFSKKQVLCKNQRKLGLIDWFGNTLLDVKYDEIQAFGNNQFRVNIKGKWGVVAAGDQIIVPFNYDYITPLKSKICVVKANGKLGIVSIDGKEQVQPKFDKISIKNNKAEAYQNDVFTVLTFDKNGNLQGEDEFQNHVKLKIGGKKNQNTSEGSIDKNDYELDQFEWYYDAKQDKWGLRLLEDGSVHIEPVFDWIRTERDINFTLVGIEKWNKYSFDRTNYRFDMVFGLVNNENGLLVTPVELLDVRLSDFREGHPSARVVFSNGTHGLVAENGAYLAKDYAFIDDFQNGIARMSMRGRLSGNLKNENRGLGKVKNYLRAILSPNYMTDYTDHDQEFRNDAELTCHNCEWGYIDTSGQITVSPKYNFVGEMINNIGIVEKGEKIGAIDTDGNVLLECEYDRIHFLEKTDNQILQVYKNRSKYGLIDTLAEVAVDLKYDEIGEFSEGRLAVLRKGLWGFTNLVGQEIISCKYRKVGKFHEGYAAAQLGNKWGFIDLDGNIIVEFKYRRVGNFKNGLVWVATSSGVGYINDLSEKVIIPKFDKAFDFENNVARVVINGKFGLINNLGEYFVRPKYNHIGAYNEMGIAIVQIGNKKIRYGLINQTGDLIGNTQYKKILPFKEGLAVVQHKKKFGFIDAKGKILIDAQYSKAASFSEGLAAVRKDGQCGYIDKSGKEVIPLTYSRCLDFEDGKAIVFKGMRNAGVISKTGEEVISPSINGLVGFSNKRGLIRDRSWNYYYITEEARFYDGYYDYAQSFEHGIAIVQKKGKWGIINQNGMPIITPKYDKIEPFQNGYAKVRINGFSGLTNLKGELIVLPEYEFISYVGEGLFRVEQGDKIGYFDSMGEWIWELQN